MIVRTTTTFVVLGLANLAVWIAVLIHFQVAMKQNEEIIQSTKRLEREQASMIEWMREYQTRVVYTKPTTVPTSLDLGAKTEKLTRKLIETDRNIEEASATRPH